VLHGLAEFFDWSGDGSMAQGLSVILCTHNGERRLKKALSHLKAQVPAGTPWEVLLVDNASTDHTSNVALSCWKDGPVQLRITREAKLGLQCARERGLKEAQYDFVGFVDDDNWVASDWVRIASETLANDSSLGALGSICEPVFEEPEPKWFSQHHSIYAILTDFDLQQLNMPPQYLNGAGLCIRKQAWTQLIRGGFRSLMTDRVGARLSGGGDNELTQAIRLAGWKIQVEPRLRLQHFMPGQRLRWEYLRRLQRGYAESHALLDAYSRENFSMRLRFKRRLGELWWCQVARSFLQLASHPKAVFATITSAGEGRLDVIEVERAFGRMLGMLRLRKQYAALRRKVRYAPWRLRRPEECLP
jgi:glycosyltransferase involved in cell wall biosynthesis